MKVNLSKVSIKDMFETKTVKIQEAQTQVTDVFDDGKISFTNQKFIAELSSLIEDMWTDIRYGKSVSDSPVIYSHPKKAAFGIIKPVYGTPRNNEVLLEIGDNATKEKIFLNRTYPEEFRYERIVQTDHGSATTKYFDSRTAKDLQMSKHVNELVRTYLSEVFSGLMLRSQRSMLQV